VISVPNKAFAIAIFAAVTGLALLGPDRSQNAGRTPPLLKNMHLVLRTEKEFDVSVMAGQPDVVFDPTYNALWVLDRSAAKIKKINWNTGEQSDWTQISPRGCSSLGAGPVIPLIHSPFLIAMSCHRIELIDKQTLAVTRTIFEDPDKYPIGFVMSPDELYLAIALSEGGHQNSIRILGASDWKARMEWHAHGSSLRFTATGGLLAAAFARGSQSETLSTENAESRSSSI
jgi:hypothetical protein